jgi:hypothetical protein
LLLGTPLIGLPRNWRVNTQTAQQAEKTLSPDEQKWVEESALAKDLRNYFGTGYSCAESMLAASLRKLGKPEEWVWAAAGFGGGMYNRDLCGFLTGGIMALGVAAGMLEMPRREAKQNCGRLVKDYWDWWKEQAPLRCSKIRTEAATSAVCTNLGLLSAAKIEEYLQSILEEI